MKKIFPVLLLLSGLLLACSSAQETAEDGIVELYKKVSKSDMALTDELVEKYIIAYRELKKQGPDILNRVNESTGDVDKQMDGFNAIENTIQSAGFKDYPEFVVVNARIAWAFSLTEGIYAVDDFEQMKNSGLYTIDSLLQDPAVPEEAKVELRKNREKIVSQWNNDKKWADFTLNKIKKLTSDADMEVIRRHRQQLLEVYSGVKLVKAE